MKLHHCFYLVSDHGDQLDQPLKAVSQGSLGQCLKLRSLLQDLCEDLHERRPGLRVTMVAQAWKHSSFRYVTNLDVK